MLYLKSSDGLVRVIVLESANIDRIRQGKPAKTPDGSVIIAFTPDPVWLADRIMDTDGDAAKIAALIDEAAKRPQKEPNRPAHGQHTHTFARGEGYGD